MVTSGNKLVSRIDASTKTPLPIAFGMGRVWVADSNDTTLSFIDTDPDNSCAVAALQLGFPEAVECDRLVNAAGLIGLGGRQF